MSAGGRDFIGSEDANRRQEVDVIPSAVEGSPPITIR